MDKRNNSLSKTLQKHQSDPGLLTILVCPRTGGPLILSKNRLELISQSAKLAFPICDGIPIMVEAEARSLDAAELKELP